MEETKCICVRQKWKILVIPAGCNLSEFNHNNFTAPADSESLQRVRYTEWFLLSLQQNKASPVLPRRAFKDMQPLRHYSAKAAQRPRGAKLPEQGDPRALRLPYSPTLKV